MNYKDEVVIDMADLLHHCLIKWRLLFFFMLVGLVLAGSYGYLRMVPVGQSIEALSQLEENELAYLGAKLSDHAKEEAVTIVETYIGYETTYNERESILEDSFVMKYDATKVPTGVMVYRLSDPENDAAGAVNIDSIVALYKNALTDQAVITEIKEENKWECEDGYINDLFLLAKTSSDTMTVTVNAPTREACECIMKILKESISSTTLEIQKQYSHNIVMLQSTYSEVYRTDILDKQKTENDNLLKIEAQMQTASSYMTVDQRAYYDALLDEVKRRMLEGDTNVDVSAVAAQATLAESDIRKLLGGDLSGSESEKTVMSKEISVKFMLIGAVGGMLLAFLLSCAGYIFSTKLRTKSDIQTMFGISVIGEIRNYNEYKKPFSVVDKWIESIFVKKRKSLSEDERLEVIVSTICLSAQNRQLKKLYITGTEFDDRSLGFMKELQKGIDQSDKKDADFFVRSGEFPLSGPALLEKLADSDCVVLISEVNGSHYEDIAAFIDICDKLGVDILGSVVLD